MQQQTHVGHVLAGSDERLIGAMLSEGRAFYGMLDTFCVGTPVSVAAKRAARRRGTGQRFDDEGHE